MTDYQGKKGEVLGFTGHFGCNPSSWGRGIFSRNYFKCFHCFLMIDSFKKCNPALGSGSGLLVSCIYC